MLLSIMKKDVDNGKIDVGVYAELCHMIETGIIREGVDNQLKSDKQK